MVRRKNSDATVNSALISHFNFENESLIERITSQKRTEFFFPGSNPEFSGLGNFEVKAKDGFEQSQKFLLTNF